jgi:hypothetical protein
VQEIEEYEMGGDGIISELELAVDKAQQVIMMRWL